MISVDNLIGSIYGVMIRKESLSCLRKIVVACFMCSGIFSQPANAQVGEKFPLWSEGYLDIHYINTGKGESTFFLLPDGTTMLIDAGAALSKKPWATDPKPSNKRSPGEWISRYIKHMIQKLPKEKLNYILLSHFHWDHMGGLSAEMETSKNGHYKLTGITEVGDYIPFDKMIDRAWPDYNWPIPLDDDKMKNYQEFLKWHINNKGVVAEQFQVGQKNQLVLVYRPEKYPNFEIRNIAANGFVWTGVGINVRNHYPPLKYLDKNEYPTENNCSIGFRLSYGQFDYFTGGDIGVRDAEFGGVIGRLNDMETPIAMATGPVDVLKANHHANYDAMSVSFLEKTRPRVIAIHTWGASQPAMNVYRRMISTQAYPGQRDIFATNIMEATETAFNVDKLKSQQGHIVIRVDPGGETYNIFILDDSNESYAIKSIHGPYKSR